MKTSADPVLSSASSDFDGEDAEIGRFLDSLATPPPVEVKPVWPTSSSSKSIKDRRSPKSEPGTELRLNLPAKSRNKIQQVADSTQKSPNEEIRAPVVKKLSLNPQQQRELIQLLGGKVQIESQPNGNLRASTDSSTDRADRAPTPASRSQSRSNFPTSHSKQAEYARMYRQKNKRHLDHLENRIEELTRENRFVSEENRELKLSVMDLKTEVQYLRNILANESEISSLIQGISNVPGMKLRFGSHESASESVEVGVKRRRNDSRSEIAKRRKREESCQQKPGVCLHIRDDEVSVELCARCNRESRCEEIGAPRDILRRFLYHHRNIET